MTNKIRSILLMGMCGVLFSAGALPAEEAAAKPRAPAGVRAEPFEKQMARLKERDEKVAKAEKETKSQAGKKSKKKTHGKAMPMSSVAMAKRMYVTTHSGAYQNPVSISYLGDSIELMDGSIWAISSSDAYKTINWFPSDLIVISPNHSWFSSYSFRLTNQNTGESVAANLFLGPIDPAYNSIYTHWIVGIDYYHNTVFLEDGSAWNMASLDSGVVDQWMVNDVVIIGVNTGWFSSYNPNILINVNMLNYAAGTSGY